jgi:DNA repair protein RadC
MSLTDWPSQEKPREKLVHHGSAALSNAELLAILLGIGSANKDAVMLARELLQAYRGLQGLFQASFQSLKSHKGIGLAKYAQIQAALELNRRYLQEPLQRTPLSPNSNAVCQYLIAQLRSLEYEVFASLFLDSRFQLIRFEKLFSGTIDSATVHPRVIVKKALEYNARALIVAHNHPSGDISPSESDLHLTKRLYQALSLLDIQLMDHIIVGAKTTLSFAERGYL